MGYLKILRPLNCSITFVSVCVGAWIGRAITFSPALILAAMVGFVVCAFGNIVNDLFDIPIDAVNNPQRPLIKKTVNRTVVIALAVYFFILAFIFGLSLGIAPFIIILITLIMLFLYAWAVKKTLAANVAVALLTGLSFILGGVISKNPYCVYPFIFSFCIHLAREIVKDVIDKQGDEPFGVRSIPILYGNKNACLVSASSLIVLCMLIPLPFIFRILDIWYLLVVLVGALPITVFTAVKLLRVPPVNELTKYSQYMKIVMAVGLIAMIV
jgi:geranylgeranylglycerol-phosphate geranylgeranyltransferase